MRVLLDENLPLDFAAEITGHEVETVRTRGWTGVKNSELMRLAANSFDVFVTLDRNLPRQQNVAQLPFAVIVLRARSNRLIHLRPLLPALRVAIASAKPGTLQPVGP